MEIEFEKELLNLKAECRENPNIHPHCEHVVDLAISEIKRLEQQYETDTVWYHNKWMEAIKNSQASRWIPVSERLPEYSGYVLAVFEKCLPFVAMYYSGVKKFSCEREEANPTHWMPLPEPPQEVE